MNWKIVLIHLNSYLMLVPGLGQQIYPEVIGELNKDVSECSGLALLPSGNFAQINDSGNPPCIYITDTIGNVVKTECLPFAKNVDWEELAIGNNILYLADFGNNGNARKDLRIYRVGITGRDSVYNDGVINFKYLNQLEYPAIESNRNFDMEAMVYVNDSLYLFSKNRTQPFTGYTYLYAMSDVSGDYAITPVDSFNLGKGPMQMSWACGAAINSEKDVLVLLGYAKLWVFYEFPGTRFFHGKHQEFHFKDMSQKESIEFLNDSTLIITDERSKAFGGGYVYQLRLPELKAKENKWPVRIEPEEVISDSITVYLDKKVEGPVQWEIFNTKGARVRTGIFNNAISSKQFIIDTSKLNPGGYVLNVIIKDRPHAFKLKKTLK